MIGIKPINNHQPDLSVSCSRRTPTAMPGKSTANPYIIPTTPGLPKRPSINPIAIAIMMFMRKNIQYSVLWALPVNTAYFFNTSIYQFICS